MNIDTAQLPDVVVLRSTKYANKGDWIIVSANPDPEGRLMRRNASFAEILETAYGFSPEMMVLPPNIPQGRFDILLAEPKNSRETLRAEIKKKYGFVAHTETRDRDALVLKLVNPNASGLKISSGGGPNIWTERDHLKLVGYTMPDIAHVIGNFFGHPVIDETGLTYKYDVDVKWNGNLQGRALEKEIKNMMREQFGLELAPTNVPVEMLIVVEKAK